MKLRTYISFEWDTDHENGDNPATTLEEWAEYFSNLVVEDIEQLVKHNKLKEVIQYELTGEEVNV